MTLFRDAKLPDFNALLTREAMAALHSKYEAALAAHRDDGLFALADAMGLLDGLENKAGARDVLDGLPDEVVADFVRTLTGALGSDLGMYIVYVDEGADSTFSTKVADYPKIPVVLVISGPHPPEG